MTHLMTPIAPVLKLASFAGLSFGSLAFVSQNLQGRTATAVLHSGTQPSIMHETLKDIEKNKYYLF